MKIDAEIFKNVMSSFKQYFQSEEMTEMSHEMKQGVNLSEDTKQALMRLANQLFDKYDFDKSNALDYIETKKLFKDIFYKMGCPEILSDEKFKNMFVQMDTDESGTIQKCEIIAFMVLLLN